MCCAALNTLLQGIDCFFDGASKNFKVCHLPSDVEPACPPCEKCRSVTGWLGIYAQASWEPAVAELYLFRAGEPWALGWW